MKEDAIVSKIAVFKMEKNLKPFYLFLSVLIFVVGCDINRTSRHERVKRNASTSVFCNSSTEIAFQDKDRSEIKCIETNNAISFMKDHRDEIEEINIGLALKKSTSQDDVDAFFVAARELPNLRSFRSDMLGGMDDARFDNGLKQLTGLTKVTAKWNDEVLIAMAANNPQLQVIDFSGQCTNLGEKGVESLGRLAELRRLYLYSVSTDTCIIKIIEHASHFSALTSLALQHPSQQVLSSLTDNLLNFPKLNTLRLVPDKENDMLAFLKANKDKLAERPFAIDLQRFSYFASSTTERKNLFAILGDTKLHTLLLTDFAFEEDDLSDLQKLIHIKELAIQIPKHKEESLLENLLQKLTNLEKLTLIHLPAGSINGIKYPEKYLLPHVLKRLQKRFPRVTIAQK